MADFEDDIDEVEEQVIGKWKFELSKIEINVRRILKEMKHY